MPCFHSLGITNKMRNQNDREYSYRISHDWNYDGQRDEKSPSDETCICEIGVQHAKRERGDQEPQASARFGHEEACLRDFNCEPIRENWYANKSKTGCDKTNGDGLE